MRYGTILPALFLGIFISSGAQADTLVLPDAKEATQAVSEMMALPKEVGAITVALGTCIPAVKAEHSGQVACTAAVKIGAGSSETQVDFYRTGKKWVAQPSVSQDKLPFPDPKLR